VTNNSAVFPVISFDQAGHSLDNLINIATSGDHGGARRAANFLLAWWNGPELGHYMIMDALYLDYDIRIDVITILTYLSQHGTVYAYEWGRRAEIERIIDKWGEVEPD